jgi:uncharacterized protein with HEPN domain
MPSLYSDKNALYLLTILEAIQKIKIYSEKYTTPEELFNAKEQMAYNGICHLLLAIGEESKKIEMALKETQSFISWEEIAGLRNRIAHDYRGIDLNIVFQIVKNELDTLQRACEKLLQKLNLENIEFQALLNNSFYSHLGYLKSIFEE